MEPTNDTTINTDVGGSSVPAQTGGLISTTEFHSSPVADADPEGANNSEGAETKDGSAEGKDDAEKGEQAKGGEAEKEEKEEDADLTRFDKHPRFNELRTRAEKAEDRVARLEAKLDKALESVVSRPGNEGPEELPYKDISKMTAEQLLDWQSEDPIAYHNNLLAQAKYELGRDFDSRLEQRSGEDAVVSTYQRFAETHDDFDAMWDNGELQKFIQANPGHNTISAYYALTNEKQTQAATEKAVAAAEKKFTANQKAKRENKSLSAGPQTTGTSSAPVDSELLDTKKFGGPIAVMAKRLADRRRQAGL